MQQVLNLLTEMHDKVIYKELPAQTCMFRDISWTKSHNPVLCQAPPGPFTLPTKNKMRKKWPDGGESKTLLVCSWLRENDHSTRCICFMCQEWRAGMARDGGTYPHQAVLHRNSWFSTTGAKEVEFYIWKLLLRTNLKYIYLYIPKYTLNNPQIAQFSIQAVASTSFSFQGTKGLRHIIWQQ